MSNDLAKRAVACKNWRWMPGMLVMSDPDQVPRVIGSPVWPSELRARVTGEWLGRWYGVGQFCVDHPDAEHESMSGDDLPGTLPDLDDPATLGCLLALVRDAWCDQGLHCAGRYSDGEWLWHVQGGYPHGATFRRRVCTIGHVTEAEALVVALEAAC